MTSRRDCLAGIGAALVAANGIAQEPRTGVRRVGVLAPSSAANEAVTLKPFFDQMRRHAWIEGHNLVYDHAYANDSQGELPRLAAELVSRKPEVIYAPPAVAALAAKAATRMIPIIFGAVMDPVAAGLVTALGRPAGNVTGVSSHADSLAPKRVELLREILPGTRRIGLIGDRNDPSTHTEEVALAPIVKVFDLTLIVGTVKGPDDLAAVFAKLADARIDALITTSALIYNLRSQFMALARAKRVVVAGHRAEMADAGALLTYAASLSEQLRRSADLVDKVLKGAKPADIPVEQPTLFELVINLKAAQALGIKLPQTVLFRADRVIE